MTLGTTNISFSYDSILLGEMLTYLSQVDLVAE